MVATWSSLLLAGLALSPVLANPIARADGATDEAAALEPVNFNVTEALADLGVDLSAVEELAEAEAGEGLQKRASLACVLACKTLRLTYGNAVSFKNEQSYADTIGAYWSKVQRELDPYCIFKPTSGPQVSAAVLVSRATQCPFAAKSGGHAPFASGSSIEGGITISFEKMKEVSLSRDKKIASIGPGNIWGPVFEELTKSDVTVVGGRLYDIGVGGLTTGGGISYFSSIYGWACDNVDSFDVVLANGILVRANRFLFSDLYWALRGGGNNLGLVVGFNLRTIPLPGGRMWGGARLYTEEAFPALTDAFANVIANSPKDPNAGLWVPFSYASGFKVSQATLWYAKENGNEAAIYDEFNNITALSDTTQNRVLGPWAAEGMLDVPGGRRDVFYTITTKADPRILHYARDLYYERVAAFSARYGWAPTLIYQGVTEGMLRAMAKDGGNALGLDPRGGALYNMQLTGKWDDEAQDQAVYEWTSTFFRDVSAQAKKLGCYEKYVYMNYASQFQDAIASYGAASKNRLRSVAAKYDPQEVYQKLQPGYFKLNRAPVPGTGYFSF